MAAPLSTSGSTLAFLPLLGVLSPFAQAAEVPFPNLSPFPHQPEPSLPGAQVGESAAIASPLAPLAAGMSVEASEPQFLAQVLPTVGATNTQVSVDAAGQQFEIGGGIQAGDNLFHRFDQLDLEAGQVANFQTTPGLEAVFSQVGGGPSTIDGTLKVSGSSADLFLLNPNGVLFGANAQLDLSGSFVATTADRLQVGDQWIDLLEEGVTAQTAVAGSVEVLEFSRDAVGGAIANQGQLAVAEGQSLGLLGNAVVNTGSLTAPGGEVTILSASGGQRVSLGGGLLNLDLDASQTASTNGQSLPAVVAQPIAEATGLSLNADGSVSLKSGTTLVSGTVDVSSANEVGGQVRILGDEVQVTDAVVDASGAAGGEIYVGGDYQGRGEMLRAVSARLDAASVLRADGVASTSGIRPDGGEVVVWSDGKAEFAGTATARSLAPGGDGGLVETSGKQQLIVAPTANVNTTSVDGATGQWLIDPVDLTVVDGGGAGVIVGGVNDPGASTIDAATVEAGLNGNNVVLQADNSITVNSSIDASANASGGNLALDAPTLNLNERVTLVAGNQLSGTATTVNVGANGSVQNAVDAAATGGTVNLAAATYREGQEINVDKAIVLRGQVAGNTTISGDANGDGNTAGNQADNHRILNLTSNADGTTLSDITFSDGVSTSAGAGLFNSADDVTIENSAFTNNQVTGSEQDGGAIHTRGQRLSIDNGRFENNYAQDDGGAIDIEAGSVDISNSTFSDNVADGDGHGGAIDLDPNGSLTVTNTVFERNSAATDGGAIYAGGLINLDGADFRDNVAQLGGGAISLERNVTTVSDSSFTRNTAVTGDGGAIFVQANGTLNVSDSNFNQNSAAVDGGAIRIRSDNPTTFANVDFVENQAQDDGGAIAVQGASEVALDNVDFLRNQAINGEGGALEIRDTSIVKIDGSFNGNIAAGQGGAVSLADSAQFQAENTSFAGNQAGTNGGAIANTGNSASQLALTDAIFSSNQTLSGNSASGDGGALFIDGDSSTTISGTRFSDNRTTFDGGAIAAAGAASLSIDNSTLERNQALGDNGGGIFLIGDVTLNLSNSLLDGNTTVQRGGGLFQFQNAKSTILNTRFENNQAVTDGGAIAALGDSGSQLNIILSSFQNNDAQQNGGGLYVDASAGAVLFIELASFLDNSSGLSGGGLFKTNSADLLIADSLFESNIAAEHGGGLAAEASSGLISIQDGSVILQNIAGRDGGGIRLLDSNLSVRDSWILTNQAALGGGLELSGSSSAQVSDSLFQGNQSSSHGGAIRTSSNSIAAVSNSSFLNNQANRQGGAIRAQGSFNLDTSLLQGNTADLGGGGISLDGTGGDVSISSTTVNGNTSFGGPGGGLMHSGGQTTTIVDSTFSGNVASGAWNGGAIDLFPTVGGTTIQIENSTLSGNRGGNFGGALSQANTAQTTLNNVTVANNTAGQGGGLANVFGGRLTVQNTIVAGNTATTHSDVAGPITSLGNNLVQDRDSSSGYVAADLPDGSDPQLLPLADNGGLTQTHALRGFSPAVNGGNGSATLTDQRGLNRVDRRDIGAYELDDDLTAIVTGGGQTTTVNQNFAAPIQVSITDSFGGAIAGVDIGVQTPITGASASFGTLQTDDSGVATAIATANTVAGGYAVILTIGSPSRLVGFSQTNTADVPDRIAVLNGNNQTTVVNTAFVNPLQVVVTDQFGNQISNQAVSLSLPGSGASANAGSLSLVTDGAGVATTSLTANTIAGNYVVGLTSGSLSNRADLTNLPDAPNQIIVNSGDRQSTVVNTAFANSLLVTVTDQFGNAVPGVTVDLSLPGAGASVNVGAIALTTDGGGQASTPLTANTISGNYTVGLTSGSVSNRANLTNLPDAPTQLVVDSGDNQSTIVNTAFANPLQVTVTDQFGNAVPGVTVDVSLPGTGATANADANVLTTDAAGQAATGLVANTIAGGYGLALSAGSLVSNVQLSNRPDAPARLDVLNGDGQSTVVNTAFANPLLLEVTDQFGNVVPDAIVNLSLPGTGATAGSSSGVLSLTTDGLGQATTQFVANTVAGSYGIGLAAGSASNSIRLTNVPDAPAQLNLLGGSDQVAQINTAFSDELRVQVLDQFGNALPGVTVTFTAPAVGVASAALSTGLITTDGSGEGQTLATANGQAGTYQVEAQAGNATAAFNLENLGDTETPLPELPEPEELPPVSLPPAQPPQPPGGSTITQTPLSLVNGAAIEEIDSSFSAAYTDYWGTGESRGATVAETRSVLNNAAEVHGVKSAVVYGLFVPQDKADDESFGAIQVASMALNRRAQSQEPLDDDQFMLVLVPSEGSPVQQLVDVTRTEMLQQARLFRMAVSDPDDEWSYKPLAQQMYRWMLEPVESELERLQLDNIMYVMDAGLRAVPLAAMMKGDEFAIERYGISLIPSVDLMETNFGASAPSSQMVAAGATEFELLNDLPGVGIELDAIASQAVLDQAQRTSVNVLFNEAFTQENLVQAQQQGGATMLHLATHAEFNAGDLGSSYLQFWDEQLTLDDISKLGWDELELLILSACQTAISSPEAELGFAGLAAATGVESTIGSLWSVSDIGTLGLMSEFYGQLAQTPLRFEALRQAQMSMLRGETRLSNQQLKTDRGEIALPSEWDLPESADFSHPFYWSGFTLVGNPWW